MARKVSEKRKAGRRPLSLGTEDNLALQRSEDKARTLGNLKPNRIGLREVQDSGSSAASIANT